MKLRFSRKLLFVAGLLLCLSPKLHRSPALEDAKEEREVEDALVDLLAEVNDQAPLALVGRVARTLAGDSLARRLVEAYDVFLGAFFESNETLTVLVRKYGVF